MGKLITITVGGAQKVCNVRVDENVLGIVDKIAQKSNLKRAQVISNFVLEIVGSKWNRNDKITDVLKSIAKKEQRTIQGLLSNRILHYEAA
jgi:hypothetical protein